MVYECVLCTWGSTEFINSVCLFGLSIPLEKSKTSFGVQKSYGLV